VRAMAEEPSVSDFDLKELQSFLLGGTADGDGAKKEAAADPWHNTASSDPWGGGYAKEQSLPLPPGFEKGPNSDAKPAPAGGGQNQMSRLVGESQAKVIIEHEDGPQAPFLAAKSWDDLNLPKEILDGIFEMGFVKPSKIQEWTLPIALNKGNIIGQAQNGSGKSAAFGLSMLLALDCRQRAPQALCICPTRELADQNMEVTKQLGKFLGIEYFLAVPQQERPPRKVEAQVVVGTPGKLQDLIKKRVIQGGGFRIFVLDEADVMIDEDNQMGPQVMQIRGMLPEDVQILLFSATWPEKVEQFARKMVPRPNRITVQKEDLTLSTITQTFIDVGREPWRKSRQLSDLYGALSIGQSIIFLNTRKAALELAKMMKEEGHAVSLICGTQQTGAEKVDITYRDRVMNEFRSGVTKVLISTDVLARGIDVPAVTLVVNYDLPMQYGKKGQPDCETYLHRIGRTGRFGLRGVAVNLVTEQDRPTLDMMQSFFKCKITQLSGDCEEMEGLLKDLR